MKKSKKIGFWHTGILVGLLLLSSTYEAHSNSLIDSVKGFFSAAGTDDEKTSEQNAIPQESATDSDKGAVQATSAAESAILDTPQSSTQGGTSNGGKRILGEADVLRLISEDPSNPSHLFELGQLKLLDGNIEDAESNFDKIMSQTNDSTLLIIGKTLTQLFLGNIDQAYASIVSASTSSDPNVLVVKSWCEFLLGQQEAGKRLIQNATKVPNSRISNSFLASYYALVGDYDLARITVDKVGRTGFLPAQALVAKYLYTSKLQSNSETVKAALSELRNKHQLAKDAAHFILANSLMLTFNYELARENYEAAAESSSQRMAAAAQAKVAQIDNLSNSLFLELHKNLIADAAKRKNTKAFIDLIVNHKEASLRLLTRNSDMITKNDVFSNALANASLMEGFDYARMNNFLIDLAKNNRFLKQEFKSSDSKVLSELDRMTSEIMSYYIAPVDSPISEGELKQNMKSIINAHPSEIRLSVGVNLFFDYYCQSKISDAKSFSELVKRFKTSEQILAFMEEFVDVKLQTEKLKQERLQRFLERNLAKLNRQLEKSLALTTSEDSQKKLAQTYEGFKANNGLNYDQAIKELGAVGSNNCFTLAIEYYLTQRFKKANTSQKLSEYLKCVSKISPDLRDLEQSIGIFIELLYLNEQYTQLISFYRDYEEWILRVSPFSSVHYIDSLGRTGKVEEAKLKAREVCAKVPSEICSKISLEIIPIHERLEKFAGTQRADKLLAKVGELIEKKNYNQAKALLLEAKANDPLNPFIYMFFETIYRADSSFDFLGQYTTLLSTFLSTPNLESDLRTKLIDRIFDPCESPSFPCEVLVNAIEDNRFKDLPKEKTLPAYAAQLIRIGKLEEAAVIIDEMTKSSNPNLQRKGIVLKASLTDILRQVQESGAFEQKMIEVPTSTSV